MKNSDQPAFPISEEETDRIDTGVCIYTGVTKREYFAAKAMQGLLSIYSSDDGNDLVPNNKNVAYMAKLSVNAADELLAAIETNNSESK